MNWKSSSSPTVDIQNVDKHTRMPSQIISTVYAYKKCMHQSWNALYKYFQTTCIHTEEIGDILMLLMWRPFTLTSACDLWRSWKTYITFVITTRRTACQWWRLRWWNFSEPRLVPSKFDDAKLHHVCFNDENEGMKSILWVSEHKKGWHSGTLVNARLSLAYLMVKRTIPCELGDT